MFLLRSIVELHLFGRQDAALFYRDLSDIFGNVLHKHFTQRRQVVIYEVDEDILSHHNCCARTLLVITVLLS